MRINKNTYPRLEEAWALVSDKAEKPYYVSHPFIEATKTVRGKFLSEMSKYEQELHGEPFCLLSADTTSGKQFYEIDVGVYGQWSKKYISHNRSNNEAAVGWRDGFIYVRGSEIHRESSYIIANYFPFYVLLFKKYAKNYIQYKQLPPQGKVKDIHCKYKSDFDFKIGLLTESWFTSELKDHPIFARGHFKMIAHGTGMSERYLGWIDPYTRSHWKREAGVNNQE